MEEYINKYRNFKFYIRLIILLFLSLIPASYTYFNDVPIIEEELGAAQTERDNAKGAFERAKARKANLPKLEEQLAATEKNLQETSKKLPDNFIVDKILQKTASLAQESGIKILLFQPEQAIPSATAFRYAKLPIKLEVLGTYAQTAAFFDKITHLETQIHLSNIKMTAAESDEPGSLSTQKAAGSQNIDPITQQKQSRIKTRVKTNAYLMTFRTLSMSEQSAIDAIERPRQKQSNQKQNKKEDTDS